MFSVASARFSRTVQGSLLVIFLLAIVVLGTLSTVNRTDQLEEEKFGTTTPENNVKDIEELDDFGLMDVSVQNKQKNHDTTPSTDESIKVVHHSKKKLGKNLQTSATLTASPDVLASSLSNVVLTWSGRTNASIDDFIAIYAPASSMQYFNGTGFIGYLLLNQTTMWSNGTDGQTTVPLVNMRAEYGFALWGNGGRDIIAVSNNITFANVNEPLQGHLALTDDPTQVIVMWVTAENQTTPTVQFGTSSGNYEFSSEGVSYTYTINDMCMAPANTTFAWRDPGFIHEATIMNLSESTQYFYRFGNNITGWSPEYNFFTSPGANPDVSVDLFVYGDLGVAPPFLSDLEQQYPSVKTVHWIAQGIQALTAQGKPTGVLHIGDISYARGFGYLWDYFFSMLQPVATSAPYMVGIGNHEYDMYKLFAPKWGPYGNDSGGECGIPYSNRFHMPNSPPAGQPLRNLWWSFDYGPIHFVIISTEHNFSIGSDQYNWVKQDMASVNRSVTPWLIFAGHRPMFASSNHLDEVQYEQYLREAYEPMFASYKVDACLWGHWHVYERTCGMFDMVCADSDNDAPVHVTVGAAGNNWQPGWIGTNGEELQPDWVVFRTINYGYGRIFANSTHFNLQFHGDQRNEVHDSFWLTK